MSSVQKCVLRDGNRGSLCLLPSTCRGDREPATHRDAVAGSSPVSSTAVELSRNRWHADV